jgi:hypothetical protein
MQSRFGFWSAVASLAASVGYGVPQILQVLGLLPKPWDEILIFGPSLVLAPAFVLTLAPGERERPDRASAERGAETRGADQAPGKHRAREEELRAARCGVAVRRILDSKLSSIVQDLV